MKKIYLLWFDIYAFSAVFSSMSSSSVCAIVIGREKAEASGMITLRFDLCLFSNQKSLLH